MESGQFYSKENSVVKSQSTSSEVGCLVINKAFRETKVSHVYKYFIVGGT